MLFLYFYIFQLLFQINKSTFMQAVKPCITTTNESTTTLMYFPLKQSTIKTPKYVSNTLQMFLFFINGFNFTCFLSFYLLSFIFLLCSCIRFPFFLLKPISSSLQWQNFPTGINKVSSHLIFYESKHKGKTLCNIKDTVTVKSTTER